MKIPYPVSSNVRWAYATSDAMNTCASEADRKIRAEDFEWDDDFTPAPLSHFAALALSRIFHRLNPLNLILQKDVDALMDLYPPDIPLKYSVPFIKDEQYWKRCLELNYPNRVELGIKCYKGKYLSVCLQTYLQNINPDVFIEADAVELAKLVSPYIAELRLNELQMMRQPLPPLPRDGVIEDTCPYSVEKVYDHIPLEPVLSNLYKLEEITLIFGINNLNENYLTRYFEFTKADCESLCDGLKHLKNLKIFRINRSNLDCLKAKTILQILIKINTIEEIDFSHCQIGDYGMKALGGFVFHHKNLRILRVANNRFKEEGVQGIAYALQMKPAAPIELLDFSLNPMSVECATMFAASFVRLKEKPQTLIINSCGFYGVAAEKMVGLLSLNRGLKRLDIAANNLSGEPERTLIRSLEQNRNVLNVDLRCTHISEQTRLKVEELLERNRQLVGVKREPSAEIPPLYLNEPEYLIWEYNPNNPNYIPGRYPVRVAEV